MSRISVPFFSRLFLNSVMMALLFPAILCATPVEVTFFPHSAQVTEITKLRLQPVAGMQMKAVFTLPGQADPDTLVTRISGNSTITIEDQTWKQVANQDEEAIRVLKKKIEELREERTKIQAGIKSLETQVQFWQMQTKAKFKTLADAANMSTALGKYIKKALVEKSGLESENEKLDKRLRQLQDELNAAGGRKETVWEVTALLSGAAGPDISLTYTYTLRGCGWMPLYRLEARPLHQQVLFSWEGEIWQSSGQDWNHVAINLANRQPPATVTPGDMPAWIIKPRPLPTPVGTAKKARSSRMADAMPAMEMDANVAAAAPTLVNEGTYTSWALGKRSLAAGARQRVKVLDEAWPAEFTYLSRPGQGEQVFVRASVKFTETREIPQGSAVVLIDGAMVGKRPFAVSSREETIFFGTDPMLKAKSILLTQKSGEKTFLQDKQTHVWDWRIDLENNRNYDVKMRIEEPNPQARDERIKMTFRQDPPPTEKTTDGLIWILDLPALGKRSILTGVSLEAPKDMLLDLGWRR